MKKNNFFQKFKYWLDNTMARGTRGMIGLLGLCLVVFVIVTGLLTYLVTDDKLGIPQTIWDTFANTTNAWIIQYSEADGNILHLLLMGIAGIVGILVTSILVGIFSNGIQEKVDNLKKGKSKVLEHDHVVLIGFNRNTYKLVEELCNSLISECIVIAGAEEKDVMEDKIQSNIQVPDNIKIVCRNIDATDLTELECLSIENASAVVVVDKDDAIVVKTVLTVTKYLKDYPESDPALVAIVNRERNINVTKYAGANRFIVIHTGAVVAGIIAQACIQKGISKVFTELFTFEGNEIYYFSAEDAIGMSYKDMMLRVMNATPLGFVRNGTAFLNPHGSAVIQKGDQIIALAKQKMQLKLSDSVPSFTMNKMNNSTSNEGKNVGIIGYTHYIKVILPELDEADCKITLTSIPAEKLKTVQTLIHEKDISAEICKYDEFVEKLPQFDHIILLSDETHNSKEGDNQSVFRLLTLRSLRKEKNLKFNTVVELQQQKTKDLLEEDTDSEYIITTDVSSMMASQLVFNPSLATVFKELISYEGNEIVLIDAFDYLEENKEYSIIQIRSMLLGNDEVFMGYTREETDDVFLNPKYDEKVTFKEGDKLIVLTDK